MDYKKKIIELMEKHDIDYCAADRAHWETCSITGKREKIQYIDIDAPTGYRFEPELHMLVCYSWKDAYLRVSGYLESGGLESCEDGACGDGYECHGDEEK